MATVRGGIDQDRAVGGPHDVATPQVAVQSCRSVVVVEIAAVAPRDHRLDIGAGAHAQPWRGQFGHWRETFGRVEGAPRPVGGQRHRHRLVQRTEESGSSPAVGWRTERRGTGIVGVSEAGTESMGCCAVGRHRAQPLQGQTRLVVTDDPRAGRSAIAGGEPGQTSDFAGEKAWRCGGPTFAKGVHASDYGCPETLRSTRSRTAAGRLAISITWTLGPAPTT